MGNLWTLTVEPKQVGIDKVEPSLFVLRSNFKKTKEEVGAISIESGEVTKPGNPLGKCGIWKFCLCKDHGVWENFAGFSFISSGNCASNPHVAGVKTLGDGGIAIRHDVVVVIELAERNGNGKVLFGDGEKSWIFEGFVFQSFGGAGGNGIPIFVFLITSSVGLDPVPEMIVFKSKMNFAGTFRQKDCGSFQSSFFSCLAK